jgi:hypothetical protein
MIDSRYARLLIITVRSTRKIVSEKEKEKEKETKKGKEKRKERHKA